MRLSLIVMECHCFTEAAEKSHKKITPRRACTARGKVIAVGLVLYCLQKKFSSYLISQNTQ